MTEISALMAAFLEATGRDAVLWERREGQVHARVLAASSDAIVERTRGCVEAWDVAASARSHGFAAHLVATGDSVGWLLTPPGIDDAAERLVGRVVPLVRRLVNERDGATKELVERYEEINLLYAIGELLGSSTSVESVADTLLVELATTIGARRAVFLETRRAQGQLVPIASLGLEGTTYDAVPLDAHNHIAVRAFRSGGACTEDGAGAHAADPCLAAGDVSLLAVAIARPTSGMGVTGSYPVITRRTLDAAVPGFAPPTGTSSGAPLGVLVLAGRPGGGAFTAGDRKLALAVSTQVGTAMHNASLVRAAIERQQLVREMQLAQELQLKLLPDPGVVAPEARAAARVVAAESVGGDFYLLARLDRDRTGVLIGDVSGHGYQSALVMALALSAAAIHVQAAFDPSIAVEAVQRSLQEELTSTEMSVSLCYAVIDSRAGELRFANAGHPHAFRLGADGALLRLAAVAPPLGFADGGVEEYVASWRPGDRLVFLTDGVVDARDAEHCRLGEPPVLARLGAMPASATPQEILDAIFADVQAHIGRTPLRDDCTVVVVDRPVPQG